MIFPPETILEHIRLHLLYWKAFSTKWKQGGGERSCAQGSGEGVNLVNSEVPFSLTFIPLAFWPHDLCWCCSCPNHHLLPKSLLPFNDHLDCYEISVKFNSVFSSWILLLPPWDFHEILFSIPVDFVCPFHKCLFHKLCQAYRHNTTLVKTVDQTGMVFISRQLRSHAGRSWSGQGPRGGGGNLLGQGSGWLNLGRSRECVPETLCLTAKKGKISRKRRLIGRKQIGQGIWERD